MASHCTNGDSAAQNGVVAVHADSSSDDSSGSDHESTTTTTPPNQQKCVPPPLPARIKVATTAPSTAASRETLVSRWWPVALSTLVSLLGIAVALYVLYTRTPPYVQQTLAHKLTVKHAAAILTEAQILGTQPLELGRTPKTLDDLRLSFEHDLRATGARGICAMHYDFGVSACMLRELKGRAFVMLYNLWLTGYRPEEISNWETSLLCDDGLQRYQVPRFTGVWIRYRDEEARLMDEFIDYPDPNYRVVQHLYWTNRRQLPCVPLTIQEQAEILREAALMRENDQYRPY